MGKVKLSKSMTENQFDTGYWYTPEIKEFAEKIGILSAHKLRKDELEKAVKLFLRTGKVKRPTQRNLSKSGIKDVEKGLSLNLPIVHYTSNRATKDFIVKEAKKIAPHLKRKSGARYRLNRWREEQLTKGIQITYKDLVKKYVELNQTKGRFDQIPSGRYINFLSDFLAAEKKVTKEQAIRAWHKLKSLNIPKNYEAWKNCQASSKKTLINKK